MIDADFEAERASFTYLWRQHLAPKRPLDPIADPVARLDQIVSDTPRRARPSLALALADCLEMTADLGQRQVRAIDEALAEQGLPGLTELRARHWKRVRTALKRGAIRNDAEFQAVRSVAAAPILAAEAARITAMLAEYEDRRAAQPRKTSWGRP